MRPFAPPNLMERHIPGFAEWGDRLSAMATAGYTLALNVRLLHPELVTSSFPDAWIDYYLKNNFALRDPVLLWATYNSGYQRWSAIGLPAKVPFARRVIDAGAQHGLIYGAIFVQRNPRAQMCKCFLSVSRSDREFTDAELHSIDAMFGALLCGLDTAPGLTDAEAEVLQMLATGLTQNEIADMLNISRDAVKKRIERARHVLGARNTPHAIAIALQRRVIHLDQV